MIENELIIYYMDVISSSSDYFTDIRDIHDHMCAFNQTILAFFKTKDEFKRYYTVNSTDVKNKIEQFEKFHIDVFNFILEFNSIEVSLNRALTPFLKNSLYNNGFSSNDGVMFTRD